MVAHRVVGADQPIKALGADKDFTVACLGSVSFFSSEGLLGSCAELASERCVICTGCATGGGGGTSICWTRESASLPNTRAALTPSAMSGTALARAEHDENADWM